MNLFLVQAASVGFVPWIPIALSLKVVVRVDADLTVWDIYILPNQTVDLNHPVNDSSDTTPIVTYAAIAGVVIIACLFFACLYCYVYRQRQVLRRGQRVLTSNVTTARNVSEGTPPYPGQEPPSY